MKRGIKVESRGIHEVGFIRKKRRRLDSRERVIDSEVQFEGRKMQLFLFFAFKTYLRSLVTSSLPSSHRHCFILVRLLLSLSLPMCHCLSVYIETNNVQTILMMMISIN
ncbi:hypothetical protein Bca4012_078621 [Brassica carinata]